MEGPRLPLPTGIVGDPVIRGHPNAPHVRKRSLDFALAVLSFLDQASDGGLAKDLPHGHRMKLIHDLREGFIPSFHLRTSRTTAFYRADRISALTHRLRPATRPRRDRPPAPD